jgi:chemotaxis family two-component system sensor histidine kinase/response regulator PixL
MLNPEIRDQAYQFFIEEAVELLQVIETGLLNLKNNKNTAKIHKIMRAAHSIKGGSASVGLDSIKTISHRLEDIFKALYNETVIIDTELETQLLQAYDCLRQPLIAQIETGSHQGELALTSAIPLFEQIEARLGDAMNADEYIPSSSDLGIDMVASMFDIDVGQEIDHLKTVLANPDQYQVGGELRAAAEVFAGFAELLNLPGFGEIATTAETALDQNPEQAIAITQIAVADFVAAREQVLAGDRTQGGSPSPTLLAFITNNNSDLDNVFGALEQGSSDLDDVFGAVAQESSDLDDVFGAVAQESSDLDDVFGAINQDFESLEIEESEKIAQPANLEEAIESLDQIWTQLPSLEDQEKSATVRPKRRLSESGKITTIRNVTETPSPRVLEAVQNQAQTNLSVRVDLNRLGRMNNLVGELTINRNSLSLQNEQLQANVRELIRRFNKFQNITNKFRDLSDQTLVAAEKERKIKSRINGSIATEIGDQNSEFDSLEMDTYNQIHYLLQEVLEEMMQVEESVDDITLFARLSNQTLQSQRQMVINLRDELMWARMLPLSEILNRFPRILRDLSTQYHKSVNFNMTGVGVLVDKVILEKLYDPLMHLVRNAFDHGIETPEIRQKSGKPEQGEITIHAYHKGNQTIIEIKDDGQGINLDKIKNKAIQKGLLTREQVEILTKERLSNLIFEPGFSTADQVSEISGRGVGLDIVRSQLRAIKGSVSVISAPGEGTTFLLSLPLTLTISKLLVCLFGNSAFALPSDSIEEIVIPNPEQIKITGSGTFFHWQNRLIPHYKLSDLLQYNCPLPSLTVSKALTVVDAPQDWAFPLLILRREQHVFALEVERLVTEQELVIKPFGSVIKAPSYTYGCTILADGSIIPVIDGTLLIDHHFAQHQTSNLQIDNEENNVNLDQSIQSPRTIVASRILVVDDSSALRRTLALSLEKAGYLVLQAKDGREALNELNKNPSIDLVICDIEMPNMNGFEFLSQRRLKPELLKIPVAMLTSRGNPKHRRLAMQLGANAYFTKPYIEQEFMTEIPKIINNQKSPVLR